jgi:hypothetical protein
MCQLQDVVARCTAHFRKHADEADYKHCIHPGSFLGLAQSASCGGLLIAGASNRFCFLITCRKQAAQQHRFVLCVEALKASLANTLEEMGQCRATLLKRCVLVVLQWSLAGGEQKVVSAVQTLQHAAH